MEDLGAVIKQNIYLQQQIVKEYTVTLKQRYPEFSDRGFVAYAIRLITSQKPRVTLIILMN